MEENRRDTLEIDILELIRVIWRNILLIILTAAVFGLGVFGYTYFRVTPRYEASTTMYVNNSSFSIGATSFSVSSSELTASRNLVDTYILVLNSRTTIEKVIEEADLNYSVNQVMKMVSASEVSGTAAFTVKVSCPSPTEAELIANTIAKVLPERISEIVYGSSVQVIDYAIVPSSSSYPNYTRSTLIGAAAGAVFSILCVCLWSVLKRNVNDEIRSADDLRRLVPDIPIFVVVPDMRNISTKSYYSYYGDDVDSKSEAKKAK